MKPRTTLLLVLVLAGGAAAQLADLQPGRNFVASANFGLNRSEAVDFGDCDNDGDLDVVVGNGGDFGAEPNRIFINRGGLQGGMPGFFAEETAARFAGFPSDRTRDIEFVDTDQDGDLDVFSGNDGKLSQGIGISTFWTNGGGRQGGSPGFYLDGTASAWGQLLSVPVAQQVTGNGTGPFSEHTCDCDFADLDDDGALDLFLSSYGPSITSNSPSRIFLGDGDGVFDELWPWADPAADVNLHAFDVDLADFDGDMDIDVLVTSRNSQSRVYRNEAGEPGATAPFTDVTQTALLDSGAAQASQVTYQAEFGDVDGDGDFDLWMDNYANNLERLLVNSSHGHGTLAFVPQRLWIKDDPNQDEENILFTDYDGDGDLDALLANFSGTNFVFQSAQAQGWDPPTQGLFHRNGAASGQAPHPELPTGNPGSLTSLYARTGDLDGDGDEDVVVANDGNQQNYKYTNALGVPDAHAPVIHLLDDVADPPAATGVVLRTQVRDNTNADVARWHVANIAWSVDGGPEQLQPMHWQGSFQFRGVIPPQVGTVTWRVEVTDGAGNSGISASQVYVQGAPSPWTDLGFALPGAGGAPELASSGSLIAGSSGALTLSDAAPLAPTLLFLSLGSAPVPFKGGTLAAFPPVLHLPLGTDAAGALSLPWAAWPTGIASGTALVFQCAVQDAGAVHGVALSNAVQGLAP